MHPLNSIFCVFAFITCSYGMQDRRNNERNDEGRGRAWGKNNSSCLRSSKSTPLSKACLLSQRSPFHDNQVENECRKQKKGYGFRLGMFIVYIMMLREAFFLF